MQPSDFRVRCRLAQPQVAGDGAGSVRLGRGSSRQPRQSILVLDELDDVGDRFQRAPFALERLR
jgi:hypothetical protein